MSRPRHLELFCCAGGSSKGYTDAGFDVYGIDIDPQPNYPYPFHQGSAVNIYDDDGVLVVRGVLERLLAGEAIEFSNGERLTLANFASIGASPPCQKFSPMSACRPGLADQYPDLVDPTRQLLIRTGKPWVLENVPGAPLRPDLMLCGQMVGLELYRHRIFESNVFLWQPEHPKHVIPASRAGHWTPGTIMSISGNVSPIAEARRVMGIDWTTRHELAESIPPAYTELIGAQLLEHVTAVGVAA